MSKIDLFYLIDDLYDSMFSKALNVNNNIILYDDLYKNLERGNYLSLSNTDYDTIFKYIKNNLNNFIAIKSKDVLDKNILNDFLCAKFNYYMIKKEDYKKYYNPLFIVLNARNVDNFSDILLNMFSNDLLLKRRIINALKNNINLNYYVIFYAGVPIGIASSFVYDKYLKIEDLIIKEEYRGICASRHLISSLIDMSNIDFIFVSSDNDSYYINEGFLMVGSFYFYVKYL